MKALLKNILLTTLLCIVIPTFSAQESQGFISLNKAKVEPYQMEVTFDKTSHLLFPSPIRYVDLGSECLIASKAEDIGNVLRIKAAIKDFDEGTNFSVITEDGRFYSFDVFYSAYPESLTYDLLKLQQNLKKEQAQNILFEELKGSSATNIGLLMQKIYHSSKKMRRGINSKNFGVQLVLKGLYINEGKFYFLIQIKNSSNIPYNIDCIGFKIKDKKNTKRTVLQDKILTALKTHSVTKTVREQSEAKDVFVLDQFTLLKGQVLEIDVMEKNGGRHQKIKIKNSDLIHAIIIN